MSDDKTKAELIKAAKILNAPVRLAAYPDGSCYMEARSERYGLWIPIKSAGIRPHVAAIEFITENPNALKDSDSQ